jgi:hypothetical protein
MKDSVFWDIRRWSPLQINVYVLEEHIASTSRVEDGGRMFFRNVSWLTNYMEPCAYWEAASRSTIQEFPQHFMEPEGSLPCSQEPSCCSYPEPDESSPYHPTLRSILILLSHLRLGLPNGLSPPSFCTKTLYAFIFLPIRTTFHPYLILCDFILLLILGERRVQVMKLLIMQRTTRRYIAEDRILQKTFFCRILCY